jgi:hypothetical protein
MSAETVGRNVEAYSYALVAMRGFELIRGHPEIEPLRVPFLKIAAEIAADLGQVPRVVRQEKPYYLIFIKILTQNYHVGQETVRPSAFGIALLGGKTIQPPASFRSHSRPLHPQGHPHLKNFIIFSGKREAIL